MIITSLTANMLGAFLLMLAFVPAGMCQTTPVAEVVASDDNTIQCAVTLSEYLPKGVYRKEINGYYSSHQAPVATFVVASPIMFVERNIRIALVSSRYDHLQSEFRRGEGARFVLRLPKDYFDDADGTTIESDQVESISPLN
jgi:hypothetical protein